jgi:hypothetical protein
MWVVRRRAVLVKLGVALVTAWLTVGLLLLREGRLEGGVSPGAESGPKALALQGGADQQQAVLPPPGDPNALGEMGMYFQFRICC